MPAHAIATVTACLPSRRKLLVGATGSLLAASLPWPAMAQGNGQPRFPDPVVGLIGGIQGTLPILRADPEETRGGTRPTTAMLPLFEEVLTPDEPEAKLRVYIEGYPNLVLPTGAQVVLRLTSREAPGWVFAWSVEDDGKVFPLADGVSEVGGRLLAPVLVRPDMEGESAAIIPANGIRLSVCPPAGPSMWYFLWTETLLQPEHLAFLRQRIAAAGLDQANGAERLRGVVAEVAQRVPGWRARSSALPYSVIDSGRTAVGCDDMGAVVPSPDGPVGPASGTAPSRRPPPRPTPALPWLRPTTTPLPVSFGRSGPVRPHSRIGIETQLPAQVRSLLVLALGQGGQIDVLLPNKVTAAIRGGRAQPLAVPYPGTDLELMVRGVRDAALPERVVVVGGLGDDTLYQRDEGEGATSVLWPGTPEFQALEARLRQQVSAGRVLVGEHRYNVG